MTQKPHLPTHILLVEDNPGDADLVAEALKHFSRPPRLSTVADGEAALRYLARAGEHQDAEPPDLIMLDLNLPKKDGWEVLVAVKADDALRHIPIVIFTSSSAERDRLQAYRLSASCYITKPSDLEEFFGAFRAFEGFWMDVVSLPPRVRPERRSA